MAKVANAMTTYQAGGNREDLSDRIYNIDPFDTPGVSMIGRRNAKARTFDWQTENMPVVDANNAQEEGFELVRSPAVPVVRQTNLTQISKRDATVSASQEASDAAGKNSEMAHQMALKSKVLKCDVETIAFSRQAKSSDDSTTGIRKTESIPHQIARASDKAGTKGTHVFGTKTGLPVVSTDVWADPADPALQHQARAGVLEGSREHPGAGREDRSRRYRRRHCDGRRAGHSHAIPVAADRHGPASRSRVRSARLFPQF